MVKSHGEGQENLSETEFAVKEAVNQLVEFPNVIRSSVKGLRDYFP